LISPQRVSIMYTTFDYATSSSREASLASLQQTGNLNIMIVGLGGLGVVSLTQKIRNLIANRYPHVHTVEQRGVAQRRASTSALIRAADGFVSPSLANEGVDLLIALEPLEALRYSHLLKPDGRCFVSDSRIETIGGSQRKHVYPGTADIVASIEQACASCLMLPVSDWLQTERMLPIHASTAMLGVFCAAFGFDHNPLADSSDSNKGRAIDHQQNALAFQWGFSQYTQLSNDCNDSPRAHFIPSARKLAVGLFTK